jgi:hypothetical protein
MRNALPPRYFMENITHVTHDKENKSMNMVNEMYAYF